MPNHSVNHGRADTIAETVDDVRRIALAWWFAYYAQYQGPFDLLGVKILCINGATAECERFRAAIGAGSIPTYYPVFWYAGLALGLIGSLQIMRDSGVFGRKP